MPIRLRLALWCGSILAVALLGFSTLTYVLVEHRLRTSDDDQIAGRAHRIAALLQSTAPQSTARIIRIFSSPGVDVVLVDARGRTVDRTPGMGVAFELFQRALVAEAGRFFDQELGGDRYRLYALGRSGPGRVAGIVVGHDEAEIDRVLRTLLGLLVAGCIACLAAVVAAAWVLASRALSPVDQITRTAARIAASGQSTERVRAPTRLDEVGRLAATFNQMLAAIDAGQATQRRFVSDASHELRAPLTTIRGNADLLLIDSNIPPEERRDALEDISTEAARLTRLVDGLLALARSDAGALQPPEPLALHELVASSIERIDRRLAPGPRVSLGRCEPAVVLAVPDRLEQLLIILLENALKYTPADGLIVGTLETARGLAYLRVRDTGIGIAPEDLPHIFERFYRADPARTRGQPGSGLGLAIARTIVEESGGRIAVASEPGRGTSFTIQLPLAARPPHAQGDC